MDANDHIVANVTMHCANNCLDLVWQRAAIGVAQDKVARTLDDCSFERTQCELGVGLVAIDCLLYTSDAADE